MTASDYTIEIKIYEEQYESIKSEIKRTNFLSREAEGLRVKLFLKQIIEKRINEISEG